MKAAAAVLIALQALAALALLAFSVHAPSGLAAAAPLYFAAAAVATWWASRKSWWLLGATGVAMLAAAPGLYALLDLVEQTANRRRIAATQVSEVTDEPIFAAGRPIGVRLSFSVVVPERGYFGITPWLYPREETARHMQLQPLRWRFDGRSGPPELGLFDPGRRHRLEFEMYPPILFINGKGERCLVNVPSPVRPQAPPGPLLIDIHETPYGAPWRGGREEPTRAAYDLAAMYRAVAEGLPACKVGP